MGPVAYLLTWTTYGTWLHGDARGSVDDAHNVMGHPVVEPDTKRRAWNEQKLAEPAFRLSSTAREVVAQAIGRVTNTRGWSVGALHVGVNHVHVVVVADDVLPEVAVKSLKAWATRALREDGLIHDRKRVWTKGASTRYLNTDASRAAAVDYVTRFQ